ncbi:MAG: efflux RND transporter periplasmic adaptor subunit [Sedimentisphaerales bacterium]|nr:efflux RND transporter periplasmic adaptor subunit [Sedimentisphaerales bacterium]
MKTEDKKGQTKGSGGRWLRLFVGVLLVFASAGAAYKIYRGRAVQGESNIKEAAETGGIPVVVRSPVTKVFEERLVVQGNLEAAEFAVVSPRIQGVIDIIFVDEGDSVSAGETKLFQIDKLNLEKTVTLRRHDLAVAKYAGRERAANLKRVEADFAKAELDYNRHVRLFEKGAVTPDAFERQESIYKQSKAMVEHAQTLVDLAAEQEKQAEVGLAMSLKDLDDALVYAPLSGKVSGRFREPGEMGVPGQPALRIENTSIIEVCAHLPAQYYSRIVTGRTRMNVAVSGTEVSGQTVSYKSPTIDERLRTFEVKCVLRSAPEGFVPGAMAEIAIVLESREGLGTPSEAIVTRGGSTVVFVVKDGVSHQVEVKTGLEMSGWTEIVEGALDSDDRVVVMGQEMVDQGSRVSVQEE